MKKDDIKLIELRKVNSIMTERHNIMGYVCHWHTFYEIEIVLAGKGKHIINGTVYEEKPGDVSIMRLNDFHEMCFEEECDHLHIEIPTASIPNEIRTMLTMVEGNIISNFDEEKLKNLTTLYYMLNEIVAKDGHVHELLKKQIVNTMLLYILDNMDYDFAEEYSLTNAIIREIIAYIHDNLSETNLVDNIAREFFVSKQHLLSFFKKHTGVTLVSYIKQTRLNYAATLLATTNMKINNISEESGFNSLSSFMRNFKGKYKVSPMDMRKRLYNKR